MNVIGQGKAYCRQAQQIILNVWTYFTNSDTPNPVKATLEATCVKKDTFIKIRRHGVTEPKKPGPKRKPVQEAVDEFDRGAIRRIVQDFYVNKTWPTLSRIHERVKAELGFKGSVSTLRRILHHMGYKYGKRPTREIVKERSDIVAKRHNFLTSMKRLRETGRKIIYLDETWLNSNHSVGKCWLDEAGTGGLNVPTGKGRRLIILHAGSEDGFVRNGLLCFESKGKKLADYHDDMDGDCFTKWFNNQLLPNIPPNAIIVMDNAPYHSMIEEKTPTLSNGGRKLDMQNWLRAHDVHFDDKMIRAELNQLIQQNKSRFPVYTIDKLAAKHGHTVVRLPPYHCEFNAIELIWAQSKGGVAKHNNSFSLAQVKSLFEEELAKVTPMNWAKACDHVRRLEERVFQNEIQIDSTLSEEELSTFRFCPFEEDSSDSDSDSDEDANWPDDNDEQQLIWIPAPEISDESEMSMSDGDDDVPEFPLWQPTRQNEK